MASPIRRPAFYLYVDHIASRPALFVISPQRVCTAGHQFKVERPLPQAAQRRVMSIPTTPSDRYQAPSAGHSLQFESDLRMDQSPHHQTIHNDSSKMLTRFQILVGLYHWLTCIFIIGLVCSQLLGAVWDSTTTQEHMLYGRSPLLGPTQIVGSNDVPYADRVITCVGKGRFYEPKLVSSLLAAPGESVVLEDSTGTSLTGYRLKQRRSGSVSDALDSTAYPIYAKSCELIADTIENIFAGCTTLGYSNLTRDNLRVVDDWNSKSLYKLPHTLPILIMPYWDNALYARHAIPTWGGDACIFRLEGAYTGEEGIASFIGVNQSVHHERTLQWLGRSGGYWKNGWYEDTEGIRWYSDVVSSAKEAPYYMMHRVFDMQSGLEVDCPRPNNCDGTSSSEAWGDKFSSISRSYDFSSVYIANATEYGLFIYEAYGLRTVKSVFDLETLLSNVYTAWILHRWMLANVLVLGSAFQGKSQRSGSGICCVSRSRSFAILPIASLPRLKMTLAAFWTVGCQFEGQQGALADAWFAIYPAITHFVLIYFSILNSLGKALRRRVADVLFTPTIVALCLLHYFRQPLAESGWLSGVDGRVATLIFSDEAKQIQLLDYFTTDVAWRMNGRVKLVFTVKLCILAVNLLPLFLAHLFPIGIRGADRNLRGIERAVALCVKEVGGLGDSPPYILTVVEAMRRRVSSRSYLSSISLYGNDGSIKQSQQSSQLILDQQKPLVVTPSTGNSPHNGAHATATQQKGVQREVMLVNSYELIRLGYLVFGDITSPRFKSGVACPQWRHSDRFSTCGTTGCWFGHFGRWLRTATLRLLVVGLSSLRNRRCGGSTTHDCKKFDGGKSLAASDLPQVTCRKCPPATSNADK